jgi:hypothetical protein
MARCIGICKNGTHCAFNAKIGFTTCAKHMNQGEVVQIDTQLCGWRLTNGRLCTRVCAGEQAHCKYHIRWDRERQARLAARRIWGQVLEILWRDMDPALARTTMEMGITEGLMTTAYGRMYLEMLDGEIALFHLMNHERQDEDPRGELEVLARDRQNVHTSAVSQQTRSGLEILLETPVSSGQRTLLEIEQVWEQSHTRSIRMVLADMRQWYNTHTCRTEDDWLYRRTLDGLWSYIKQSPAREELTERLWEECYESVRMCCDGHISRLCNVLCGFSEEFKPPVSTGELLQQQMAAISEKDIPVEDKVEQAWAVFEELAIPMDQREAWIEAF